MDLHQVKHSSLSSNLFLMVLSHFNHTIEPKTVDLDICQQILSNYAIKR